MRRLIIAIMVLVASTSYAQAPRSWPTFMDENGDMKNVSASSPMPVDADVSIGSVTVNVFPVFADGSGNPATATVDASNRAIINIGSDSVGIKDAIDLVKAAIQGNITVVISSDTLGLMNEIDEANRPANEVATQTITLVANTNQAITSALPVGTPREWITISAMDSDNDFWIQYGSAAVINQSQLVHGWISIPVRGGVEINVIASTAFDLFVAEGGKQ